MPDAFGLPTAEEISHYEAVLKKSEDVIRQAQVSPFDRDKFAKALSELETVYGSFKNPHLWGNSSGHMPLWDFPRIAKRMEHGGITPDMLPTFQEELKQARSTVEGLKAASKNNPMKNIMTYLLNKRD